MEQRHTPWTANILYSRVERGRGVVADVAEVDDVPLIAAAPDLLSIAKRWAALDGGEWNVERHAAEKAKLIQDTQAAIAKATGATA